METLAELDLNGRTALERVIAASEYGSLPQAVAALTVFSHPDTVAETGLGPIFATIRKAASRGEVFKHKGRLCAYDDNRSPTHAFLWTNGVRIPRRADVQFNHVYRMSADSDCYTALANLCLTPTFLAKLTDTDVEVGENLRHRVWELYGWVPRGLSPPPRPSRYGDLYWAPPLPFVGAIEQRMRAIMAKRPKDRTVRIAAIAGWRFSDFCPDQSLVV